jgi:hypothetical protein
VAGLCQACSWLQVYGAFAITAKTKFTVFGGGITNGGPFGT